MTEQTAERQKIPDNFFDAVISTQSIHHGTEKQIKYCIKEIERVLKPNGFIYITFKSKFKVYKFQTQEKKKIEPHTWIITKGFEAGIPHFIFTKSMIPSYFKNFKIINLHKDKGKHWCILGQRK